MLSRKKRLHNRALAFHKSFWRGGGRQTPQAISQLCQYCWQRPFAALDGQSFHISMQSSRYGSGSPFEFSALPPRKTQKPPVRGPLFLGFPRAAARPGAGGGWWLRYLEAGSHDSWHG